MRQVPLLVVGSSFSAPPSSDHDLVRAKRCYDVITVVSYDDDSESRLHVRRRMSDRQILRTMDDGLGNRFTRKHWMQHTWHQYRHLTQRATWLLSNQLFYDVDTIADPRIPIHRRSERYDINPRFVEHMMGYPVDWTDYTVRVP